MTIPQVLDNKTGRSYTAATALQMSVAALVRVQTAGIQLTGRVCIDQPQRIPHIRGRRNLTLRFLYFHTE